MKILKLCLLCLVPLAMLWLGAVLENQRVTKLTQQQYGDPLSAILITTCGSVVGFMVVSKDGHVHEVKQKDAQEVAARLIGLPEDNTLLAELPCLHQSPTT